MSRAVNQCLQTCLCQDLQGAPIHLKHPLDHHHHHLKFILVCLRGGQNQRTISRTHSWDQARGRQIHIPFCVEQCSSSRISSAQLFLLDAHRLNNRHICFFVSIIQTWGRKQTSVASPYLEPWRGWMITHFNFIVHAYHCGYPQGDPKQGACGHEQSWSATASNGMHELGQIRSQVTVVYRWN